MNQAGFLDEPDMRMTCCIDVCIYIYVYIYSHIVIIVINVFTCLHVVKCKNMLGHTMLWAMSIHEQRRALVLDFEALDHLKVQGTKKAAQLAVTCFTL